jgi:hypothetical protein
MPKNPCINLDNVKDLTAEERKLIEGIIATQGMNKGRLRAAAPVSPGRRPTAPQGDVKYVWRMVAFQVSTNPQHWCMPVCADFDIDSPTRGVEGVRYRAERAKVLNNLVDRIVNTIPKEQWHGINRWRGILG